VAIVLATFVWEDLTCLAVGLLVAAGEADLWLGLAGCLAGIVAGDLGLWLFGRAAGGTLSRWRWLARRFPAERLARLSDWWDRSGGKAVLVARFLPGTRLPLYVAAGALGRRPWCFAAWVLLAGLIWVPLLVVPVAVGGAALAEPLSRLLGAAWLPLAGLAMAAALSVGAARARLGHHEFWPAWLFYLPLVPWLGWLSVRYRGLTVWTAANPGIPAGGVVGESKAAILEQLGSESVIPFFVVAPGAPGDRLGWFCGELACRGWTYPLVLKPDAGQRGAGVRKVADASAAERYLRTHPGAVLVQPYHPGPYEAGIFYVRFPGEPAGRVFSITDKVFPIVEGDGSSTLAELIRSDPRYRLQAGTFLARHAARAAEVLPAGKRFPLAVAGNHCQGTLFRDGAHLWSPELEAAIDRVALPFTGFFIGRFDVRYTDPEAFRAGRDLAVVELNGVTAESTNIYDPEWSAWRAWRVLFRQWSLLYALGAANRRRGFAAAPAGALLRQLRDYYRNRVIAPLAD
jgi:membrane protein DedA with SNARE-associated domain